MPLFRCTYIRDGKPAGMTIEATCAAVATQAAYEVLQDYIFSMGGGWILTVAPVASRQEARLSTRHLPG